MRNNVPEVRCEERMPIYEKADYRSVVVTPGLSHSLLTPTGLGMEGAQRAGER
jgi:hypothetical protein